MVAGQLEPLPLYCWARTDGSYAVLFAAAKALGKVGYQFLAPGVAALIDEALARLTVHLPRSHGVPVGGERGANSLKRTVQDDLVGRRQRVTLREVRRVGGLTKCGYTAIMKLVQVTPPCRANYRPTCHIPPRAVCLRSTGA